MKNKKEEPFQHEVVITDARLPLRLFYSNDQKPTYVLPHFHDDIEIIYLLTGSLTVNINRQQITVYPEDMILFNSNVIHSTISETAETTAYVLQLPCQFLKQCTAEPGSYSFELPRSSCKNLTPQEDKALIHLKNTLYSCFCFYRDKPAFYHGKVMSLLYDFVYTLYSAFSVPQEVKRHTNEFKYYERLSSITNYINEHYTEPITLHDLAELISVTPAYLSRFFKKALQITLTEYITSIRLEHAYTDLLTTDYTVFYIAEKNGFANYQMFVQKFKQKFHNTPLKIRSESQYSPSGKPFVP